MIYFEWPSSFDYLGRRFTLNEPRRTVLEWDEYAGDYVLDDRETATMIWSSRASIESQFPEEVYSMWNDVALEGDSLLSEDFIRVKRTLHRLFSVTTVPKEVET